MQPWAKVELETLKFFSAGFWPAKICPAVLGTARAVVAVPFKSKEGVTPKKSTKEGGRN